MFTIVDAANRKQNAELLDALYWARYDAFVLGRGWSDLARPDGRDIDQFDDLDTTYVIAHKGTTILGGCRIRPSEKPHLLGEAFSHLVADGAVPKGRNIFECSRLFVERRQPNRLEVFVELLATTVKWYRSNNINLLTGVIESWWINSFLSLGFDIAPLGQPSRAGRNSIVAVRVIVDRALELKLESEIIKIQNSFAHTSLPSAPSRIAHRTGTRYERAA